MAVFRSRLRMVAAAWLLCQAVSLSAFMPDDCCALHTAIAAEKAAASAPCHTAEQAPDAEPAPDAACPMQHHGDATCPLHQRPTGDCCAMSNGCDGPNRPLANLFSFIGVLDAPSVSLGAPASAPASVVPPAPLLCRLAGPTAPPPKA